jgi:hypothetical protein
MPIFKYKNREGDKVVPFEIEAGSQDEADDILHRYVAGDREKHGGKIVPPAQVAPIVQNEPAPPQGENPFHPSNDMNFAQKYTAGMGGHANEAYKNVRELLPPGLLPKSLVDETDEEAKANLKKLGGWGTAGGIAGEIMESALPVSKTAGLIRPLAKTIAGRFGPALADVGANALYSAATGQEGERGKAAAFGSVGAASGHALPKALSGVKPGPKAQELLDAGIQPTFGQTLRETMPRTGRFVQGLENMAEKVPLAGDVMGSNRTAQQQAFRDATESSGKYLGLGPDYLPKDVLANSRSPSTKKFAQTASDIIGNSPVKASTESGGADILALAGLLGSPGHAAVVGSGAAALGAPVVQRALTGQTGLQKSVAKLMKANPGLGAGSKTALVQALRALATEE